MPKPSAKRKTSQAKRPAHKAVRTDRKVPAPAKRAPKEPYTEEYSEYLERYELYGAGRPRLSPSEFDRLDDEMLDLLALETDRGLTDEQIVRLQELEYLLLDSEQ